MAIHIEDPRLEEALRRLCELTGETVEEAVGKSIAQRLEAESEEARSPRPDAEKLREKYRLVRERVAKLKVLDPRSPEEILGYDENGMPS
ncbi:MAG: type II toxin-antitoxin system VapB family antitoxin [Bryobacter sp.]|nr:type II toxin-antitoxin system VapB family antitoxin [Bryobacter sp.]